MSVSQRISTSSVVDIYECDVRVRLGAAGVERTDAVDPLISAYGVDHEARVVAALAAQVTFADHARLIHTAPADYTQAHVDTEEFSLRPDFLFTPATAAAVAGVDVAGHNLLIPADAKAARTTKPSAILQVTLYGLALESLGYDRPPVGALFLGAEHSFAVDVVKLGPYYRLVSALIAKFRRVSAEPVVAPEQLYGPKKAPCDSCAYARHCADARVAADDLGLVADITAVARTRLIADGIDTVAALAAADAAPPAMTERTFRRLRTQAQLQQDATAETIPWTWLGEHTGDPDGPTAMALPDFVDDQVQVGPHVVGTAKHPGSADRLPAPAPGDLFFDFEGFPLHPAGALEYLFGWVRIVDGAPTFEYLWADTEAEEKAAFETFISFLLTHFSAHPQAHVYHYAAYEVTALTRLAEKYHVFRDETRALIAGGKFVDLYAVLRHSLLAGVESYSIKKVEPMVGFAPRTGGVVTAMGSVGVYARYLHMLTTDPPAAAALQADILAYNEDDCVSTHALATWLWARRGEAVAQIAPAVLDQELFVASEETRAAKDRLRELKEDLKTVGSPVADALVDCVDFYSDEDMVAYFQQFQALTNPGPDTCVLTGMTVLARGPRANSRSAVVLTHTGIADVKTSFVIRSASLFVGATRVSPEEVAAQFGVAYTPKAGEVLVVVNAAKAAAAIAEHAVAVDAVIAPGAKQVALNAVCTDVIAGEDIGVVGALLRRTPQVTLTHTADVAADIVAATTRLSPGSYFAVQGPPGAGKTYTGAAVVAAGLAAGWSVGVCSTTHKAVENLLRTLADAGTPTVKHGTGKAPTGVPWTQVHIGGWVAAPAGQVCGGTVFAFAGVGKEADGAAVVDLLVVDEASQMSTVDALAATRCAKRVVLLGDPCQLPHVALASHDGVADTSILGHLVGDRAVIPPDQGYFLSRTFRFGPQVAAPVSELAYDGQLSSAVDQLTVDGLGGVFRMVVPSVGESRSNPAEAAACVEVASRFVGRYCGEQVVGAEDIVVVAPYNEMVRMLRRTFTEAGLADVRVGTVDAFQGQQCLVVLFAMTASGDVGGRGAGFVLDVARLNVSLSRARAVAVVVGAPDIAAGVALTVLGLTVACTAAFVDALPALPDPVGA